MISPRPAAAGALLLALGAGGCSKHSNERRDAAGAPVRVAAASDLAFAFAELGKVFEQKHGQRVELSFGSTGLLAKQLAEGAPFDVFAAANVSFVDDVVREGVCLGETKALYARGRVVMWSPDPAMLPKDPSGLADPRYRKIAIANPEHAPYGCAAREALVSAGVWPAIEKRMVFGENVQQTRMFASSGNADVALIALSLAIQSPGHYVAVDPALHAPLDQALVVCKGGARGAVAGGVREKEAAAFVELVGSPEGRAIMRRFGFLLPGEAVAL